LGLSYEYDPYFALAIARVDPLPHQLEAVYDYFLKQPRIRFLLADDPGAGKTIMAGLLLIFAIMDVLGCYPILKEHLQKLPQWYLMRRLKK
jgi:hypothetical protein